MFARQTGQPCGACHTDFPALTPFGRRFKLLGYTVGGGAYRTTPFPVSEDDKAKPWVPPISAMGILGFTNTQSPQAPPTDPYWTNNNVVLSPVSFFWGGAITENIGAFAQVTYNATPLGGFPDPFGHNWTWDNTDIRFANTTKLFGLDMIYGITANNNPTVQDVWNTTPAWTFPYAASTVAPTPASHTIIDGTFAAHVGSVGAYAFINDMLYMEVTGYRTLDFAAQNALGTDPNGAPGLFAGVAPYWRVAVEPHVGNHWLEVGTFGMIADVHPFADVFGNTFAMTDKYTDIGVDSQYQYQGDNYWFSLRGSWIHEFQKLDASFNSGAAANPTDELNTLRLQASLAYGGDNRVVLTGQYFNTWGTSDVALYANLASGMSPDSDGFIAEIAYIPFGLSAAPGWPWFNARVGLQYTWYNKFDGTTVGASANNTLFLHAWIAM
ncbi:MAG TPA: cytochrome C [Xanthobacteraceae bacterium]|nr:cytochrome C [Xanthobacteraceae bacterium]